MVEMESVFLVSGVRESWGHCREENEAWKLQHWDLSDNENFPHLITLMSKPSQDIQLCFILRMLPWKNCRKDTQNVYYFLKASHKTKLSENEKFHLEKSKGWWVETDDSKHRKHIIKGAWQGEALHFWWITEGQCGWKDESTQCVYNEQQGEGSAWGVEYGIEYIYVYI